MSVRIRVYRTPPAAQSRLRGMGAGAMTRARKGASSAAHRASSAAHQATSVAGRIAPASDHARDMATARMLAARGWTAPQLSRAAGYVDMLAHYIDRSMAPRVSGWLNETAHWVEPPRPSHRARNVALGLIGVALAAGMASMAATRRRQQLADILEPAEALEFDKEYREEQLNRSYNPAGGYSSSSGHSSWGQQHPDSVVGRGSGTGHSRGVGQE